MPRIPRELLRLTDAELDELLGAERVVRVGTVSPEGTPHVVPLWFAWHGEALWIWSLTFGRRWRDLEAGSPVACCVDAGVLYEELRGAVLYGSFRKAAGDPALPEARRAFAGKYFGAEDLPDVSHHAWLKLVPERISSWDHRKLAEAKEAVRRAGTIPQ